MHTQVKRSIIAEALKEPDREVCGLIYHTSHRAHHYPCANVAALDDGGPTGAFEIAPADYMAAAGLGRVCGVYHSHRRTGSGAVFSEEDLAVANELALPFYLYAVSTGEWVSYVPPSYHVNPVGLPFVWGTFDCLESVRIHYRQTLGVHLTDYDRDESFRTEQPNTIVDHVEEEGFTPVPLSEVRQHDVLLFKTDARRYPHHLGVYMGGNRFLHHPAGGLSRVDDLEAGHLRELIAVYRYRGKGGTTL